MFAAVAIDEGKKSDVSSVYFEEWRGAGRHLSTIQWWLCSRAVRRRQALRLDNEHCTVGGTACAPPWGLSSHVKSIIHHTCLGSCPPPQPPLQRDSRKKGVYDFVPFWFYLTPSILDVSGRDKLNSADRNMRSTEINLSLLPSSCTSFLFSAGLN